MFAFMCEEDPALERKLKDPNMSLDNNPLYKPTPPEIGLMERNYERLRNDARRRENPLHGRVYGTLMDSMRLKNLKGE